MVRRLRKGKQKSNAEETNNVQRCLGIKAHFEEWCSVTTCSGVIDYCNARTVKCKVFWLAIILIALVLTIWQTASCVDDFVNGKKYETSLTIMIDSSPPFPNVTICNFNRFNKELAGSLNKDGLTYALNAAPLNYLSNAVPDIMKNMQNLKESYKNMSRDNNITDIKDLFHKYGFSCEDMVVACVWNFALVNCCQNAVEFVNMHGRCWTILPRFSALGSNEAQIYPGSQNGLLLVLDPKTTSSMTDLITNNLFEDGFMISMAYTGMAALDNFNSIPPGAHAWLNIEATKNVFQLSELPLMKLPCQDNDSLTYFDVEYTLENCVSDCWAKVIYKMYNCVYVGPIRSQYRICSAPENEEFNRNFALNNSDQKRLHVETNECTATCLLPCRDYWSVKTTMSMTNFMSSPIHSNMATFMSQLSENKLNVSEMYLKTLISANIYFGSLQYRLMETKERNPLFTFIGNIGGQLSLWLGISIITIIQLLYYCATCLRRT